MFVVCLFQCIIWISLSYPISSCLCPHHGISVLRFIWRKIYPWIHPPKQVLQPMEAPSLHLMKRKVNKSVTPTIGLRIHKIFVSFFVWPIVLLFLMLLSLVFLLSPIRHCCCISTPLTVSIYIVFLLSFQVLISMKIFRKGRMHWPLSPRQKIRLWLVQLSYHKMFVFSNFCYR